MKIYTKGGDKGHTSVLSGRRLPKAACLIEINGSIDSLHSQIMRLQQTNLHFDILDTIYDQLMSIATEVSLEKQPEISISEQDIIPIEELIDSLQITLTEFVRFRKLEAIEFNEARVRTRELERKMADFSDEHSIRPTCLAYINRLSDLFFAISVDIEFNEKREN